MKYTKEQLQEMSDLDINKALAVLSGWRLDNGQNNELSSALVVRKHCDGITRTAVDYCNNWNDVMPLALVHNLDIELREFESTAATDIHELAEFGKCNRWFSDGNPQRAMACCLILVLQESKK